MKKILKFNDFLFENINTNVLSFKLSDRLKDIIKNISHPIALKLLDKHNNNEDSDITIIDYDDNDISKFTYLVSNKLFNELKDKFNDSDEEIKKYFIKNYNKTLFKTIKTISSIGKMINKIFPNEFKASGDKGNDIESFANEIKTIRNLLSSNLNDFKIVEGDDINHWYYYRNYDSHAPKGSVLGNSCMKHGYCADYLTFYAINPVKLVILMSKEEGKILGRALLWNVYVDDDKELRQFLDRIYTVYESDIDLFKEFAKRNGWIYKKNQTMFENEIMVDTKKNISKSFLLKTEIGFKRTEKNEYPYMDTFKYFYVNDEFLSNSTEINHNLKYKLEDSEGEYVAIEEIYVEYYKKYIEKNKLQYCQLGNEYRLRNECIFIYSQNKYSTKEFAENNLIYLKWENKYEVQSETFYLKQYDVYVSKRYAYYNLIFIEKDNTYYKYDDCYYSSYYHDYIYNKNAVLVIINLDKKTDYRKKDDDTYFEYDNTYYDNALKNIILK
jgi:hypothetical protein